MNGRDLDIGPDFLTDAVIGEILGFLSFVAIIYWLFEKSAELWDKIIGRGD